jgi:hypothetical protein
MKLITFCEAAGRETVIDCNGGNTDLWCATVVLQHDDGHLGFDALHGAETLRALVQGGVLVELVNSPDWFRPDATQLPSQIRRSGLKGAVTCSGPLPPLIDELDTLSLNRRRAKQNDTLERHGRELLALSPTRFDDWITPEHRVRLPVVEWLADGCHLLTHWWFSDLGVHARCFGRTRELAIAPIFRVADELRIPVNQVATRSALPTW